LDPEVTYHEVEEV